ncbi:hypothetical protein NP493_23g05011 [Ridgeia piscesae]|uniref:Transmembrane protein n=1 Tax=Ridgeia piscesae TaxID=27915 RepID=A0AAD9UKN7_RIDPI|nr:hypothetical protein NP493_23g05011 [Ridgeia piscesae]
MQQTDTAVTMRERRNTSEHVTGCDSGIRYHFISSCPSFSLLSFSFLSLYSLASGPFPGAFFRSSSFLLSSSILSSSASISAISSCVASRSRTLGPYSST